MEVVIEATDDTGDHGSSGSAGAWQQVQAMKTVVIHSDGACEGNPGPGGWAAVLQCDDRVLELSGGDPITTNNRMELQAAIEGLQALQGQCQVEFYTDSVYLRDGISSWIAGWKQNGWRTTGKKPVKNADLWRALDAVAAKQTVAWRWVKGHAGHDGNERCDRLAVAEIAKLKQRYTVAQLKALLLDYQEREKRTEQLELL